MAVSESRLSDREFEDRMLGVIGSLRKALENLEGAIRERRTAEPLRLVTDDDAA